jgi:hypothetical protein
MLTTLSSSPPQNLEAMTKDRNRLAKEIEDALAQVQALQDEITRLRASGQQKVHISRRGSIRIKPGTVAANS